MKNYFVPAEGGNYYGDVSFKDNKQLKFGDSNDLQIYHDGSDSFIDDTGTGWLRLRGNGGVILSSYSESEIMLQATRNSSVALYYDNSKKFETTNTGVSVTGSLVVSNDITATGDLDVRDIDARNGIFTGNVGIGTTSPTSKLEIQDGSIKLNNTSSYPSTNRILATWNGSSSPPMGGIGWEQNPGFIGSEWTHYKQTSPYTMARIRLIGDASSGGMFVNLNGSDVFTIQTSSGNVGIGTTNPQTNLHIKGSSNSAFTGTGEHLVRIESDTTNNQYTGIGFSQASGIDIAKIAMKRTSSGSNLFFGTSNNYGNGVTNAALVIDHSGNVGMGITTPSSNMSSSKVLELSSTGNAEIVLDHIDGGTASDIGLLSFERSGDHLAHIKATHDGATDSAFISFHTQATGGSFSNAASNEKMRITSAGNVGIGAASPSSKLHVKDTSLTGTLAYFEASASAQGTTNVRVDCLQYGIGIAFFRDGSLGGGACSFRNDSGTQVGSINIGTSSTFYSTSSDYRLKENLTLITDGIDRLKQLKPKRFNFIGETQTVDGFIAHEAKEVVPESVTGEKDEVLLNGDPVYQGIDQSKIVPLLTAALQEAVKKIEDLETRIQTLEKK